MNHPLRAVILGLIIPTILLSAVVSFDLAGRGLKRHPLDLDWPQSRIDVERGRELTAEYGCGACHVIPGVPDARGRVGPKLEDFGNQMYVAGVMKNTSENVALWIRLPRAISAQTAMPDLHVTEEEARQIAAFLRTVP